MSAVLAPLSGALVAGGVYYGFSNLVRTLTQQHIRDLHLLNARLESPSTSIFGPPSAASRISNDTFLSQLGAQWNKEVELLVAGVHSWDRKALDSGRRLLYGFKKGIED